MAFPGLCCCEVSRPFSPGLLGNPAHRHRVAYAVLRPAPSPGAEPGSSLLFSACTGPGTQLCVVCFAPGALTAWEPTDGFIMGSPLQPARAASLLSPPPISLDSLSGPSNWNCPSHALQTGRGAPGCPPASAEQLVAPSASQGAVYAEAPSYSAAAPSHPHPGPWRQGWTSWHRGRISTQRALCLA